MNVIDDKVVKTIISSIHGAEASVNRIIEWHINENIVKPGNNYASQVYRLTIRYQTHEQKDETAIKETILFLKVPVNASVYNALKAWNWYKKEVIMYTEVLPLMYTIEDDGEYFTPKFHNFDDKMSLVLEDLSQSGYKCADRIEQLDFEHCFYALRSLAKFHALSVKLEKINGLPDLIKRSDFMDTKILETTTRTNNLTISLISLTPTFIDSLPQELKHRYPHMMEYFIKNLSSLQSWNKMIDDSNAIKFKVLNHGDFRTTNIMFKYNNYETIEKVKLIDFQTTTWTSPVRDLIYFTITSMKFEVYLNYFPLLMKIYADTLNKMLYRLDCPTYSVDNLFDDMDIMYELALYILSCILPGALSDPNNPIDCEELTNNDELDIMNGTAKAYKQQSFQNVAYKWFEYFAQKGTLRCDGAYNSKKNFSSQQ